MLTLLEVDRIFRECYRRAAIIRFEMPCDDPNRQVRNKFGILLNKDLAESNALLAITTSNPAFFSSSFLENDIVRVSAGSYSCFPLGTIVSLREIKQYELAWMKGICALKKLTFQGELSSADMTEVDQKLSTSRLIEGNVLVRLI
jgi:hypothetical protein